MDGNSRSPWWYIAGTAALLAEGISNLRQEHASPLARWGYFVAAAFFALAARSAWREARQLATSTAPPNVR
jgi:hypothetical protein